MITAISCGGTGEWEARMEAIRIIKDEHRSLGAVLHGMLYLVHRTRDRGEKPNFDVLGAMIYYIDAFPERFHHPKDDQYLFRSLRIRYPDSAEVLEQYVAASGRIRRRRHRRVVHQPPRSGRAPCTSRPSAKKAIASRVPGVCAP